MAAFPDAGDSTQGQMLWDLRVTRAYLISSCLFDAFEAQREFKFHDWYTALRNTYTWSAHQIPEKKDKKDDNWDALEKDAIAIFNKFPGTFNGHDRGNSKAMGEIMFTLEKLQKWLLDKMNQAGMFGMKYYEEA